eukprot:jgi/Ulvmu1/7855/UM004_0086.1
MAVLKGRLQPQQRFAVCARIRNKRLTRLLPCRAYEIFSPSKINLFLRIIRRRDDGFHDLASLFHVIDLGDTLSFEPVESGQDSLQCNVEDVPTDGSNLIIRALDLFRKHTGITTRFAVKLDKKVPHGAGLGGGSGNAATALWAANELSGRPASNADLLEWSGEIGSDISIFFSDGAAYCTGRGEIVDNVDPPVDLATPLLLVKPPIGLSTPQIFKALDLERRSDTDPLELLSSMRSSGKVLQELCVNDLEQPAFDTLPELLQLKERLKASGAFESVFMTGSGSTIVGVGSDAVPDFVSQDPTLFVSPARLVTRKPGQWYEKPES